MPRRTNTIATSTARQELQKNLAEKSKQSIEFVPFELREHGSLTVAIDTRRLPEFKKKLKQIRKELDSFI